MCLHSIRRRSFGPFSIRHNGIAARSSHRGHFNWKTLTIAATQNTVTALNERYPCSSMLNRQVNLSQFPYFSSRKSQHKIALFSAWKRMKIFQGLEPFNKQRRSWKWIYWEKPSTHTRTRTQRHDTGHTSPAHSCSIEILIAWTWNVHKVFILFFFRIFHHLSWLVRRQKVLLHKWAEERRMKNALNSNVCASELWTLELSQHCITCNVHASARYATDWRQISMKWEEKWHIWTDEQTTKARTHTRDDERNKKSGARKKDELQRIVHSRP